MISNSSVKNNRLFCLLILIFIHLSVLVSHASEGVTTVATVMGQIDASFPDQIYIIPLVFYENGQYKSIYQEDSPAARKNKNNIRGFFKNYRTFWVYSKGELIGTFEVKGDKDGKTWTSFYLTGDFKWQSASAGDRDKILQRAVALSRPIPQPFWPKGLKLSPAQTTELKSLMDETLKRAPSVIALEQQNATKAKTATPHVVIGMRSGGKAPKSALQKPIGNKPQHSEIQVFDFNHYGQPEVFFNEDWKGKPCERMVGTIFACWKGKWEILKRATYMQYCPWDLTAGERDFHIDAVVDIDGDGIAEVVITEVAWELYKVALYKLKNGKLVKVMDIGEWGF